MMRKRLGELSSGAPYGEGSGGGGSEQRSSGGGVRAGPPGADAAERSARPMYTWSDEWPELVQFAQAVVRGGLTGALPDKDRVRSAELLPFVCFRFPCCDLSVLHRSTGAVAVGGVGVRARHPQGGTRRRAQPHRGHG